MVQHVSHRHSDEIAQLNAEIASLSAKLTVVREDRVLVVKRLNELRWDNLSLQDTPRRDAEEIVRLRELLAEAIGTIVPDSQRLRQLVAKARAALAHVPLVCQADFSQCQFPDCACPR